MELEEGGVYVTHDGTFVGPLEAVAVGQSVVYSAVMPSGRRYFWSSDGEACGPATAGLDIERRLSGQSLAVGFATAIGSIHADVTVYERSRCVVDSAMLERDAFEVPLGRSDLDYMGVRRGGNWYSLRTAIYEHALAEAAA